MFVGIVDRSQRNERLKMAIAGDLRASRSGLRTRAIDLTSTIYAKRARSLWSLGPNDAAEYQRGRLREVYRVARDATPYYRERGDRYPPRLSGDTIEEDLSRLPLLPKAEVKEHNEQLWATSAHWSTRSHSTSGTSGTPLRLQASLPEKAFARAMYSQWLRSIGAPVQGRTLALSGFMTPGPDADSLAWRDYASGRLFLSIYSLDDEKFVDVVRLVRSFRPRLVSGYASAINELARKLNEHQESPMPVHAVTTAEVLLPAWRAETMRAFGSCFDFYGSQEGSHFVAECAQGSRHVNPYIGIVEVIEEDGSPTRPGAIGRVVVTGLNRTSMPLLRYELGDAAEAVDPKAVCGCGLWWPQLGAIQGRSEELVRTDDGRHIGMLGYSVLKDLPNVRQAQIIQRVDQSFTVRLVTESGTHDSTVEHLVRNKLAERVGRGVRVDIEYVPAIARGPGGKVKAVIVERGS